MQGPQLCFTSVNFSTGIWLFIHPSTHQSIPPSVTVPPSVYPSVCRPCWHLTKIKVCNLLTSRIYYKYGEFKKLGEFSVSITVPPFTLIFILPCFKVGMVGGWWEWLVVVVDVWWELCAYCLPQSMFVSEILIWSSGFVEFFTQLRVIEQHLVIWEFL